MTPTRTLVALILLVGVSQAQSNAAWAWRRQALMPPIAPIAAAYDEVRQRGVLLASNCRETWEWDGRDWRCRATVGAPAEDYMALVCWDPAGQQILQFAGLPHPNGAETWTYDGVAWTQRAVVSPSPRMYSALAADPVRQRVVLFGGVSVNTPLDDTWEWDGSQWQQQQPLTRSPDPAGWSLMAFNPATLRMALLPTAQHVLTVVEEWDGIDWSQLAVPTPVPLTDNRIAVTDPVAVAVRLSMHDSQNGIRSEYLWDGTQLTLQSSTAIPVPGRHGFVDSARGDLVLVPPGGRTWALELSNSNWSARTATAPTMLYGAVHLPWRDAWIGLGVAPPGPLDLWLRTELGFQNLGPPPTQQGKLLVHPGMREVFWISKTPAYVHMWRYLDPGWTAVPITLVGWFNLHVLGVDPVDEHAFLVSSGQVYKWHGAHLVPLTTLPFQYGQYLFGAYDADRGVLAVLQWHSQLWEWDGASWTVHALPTGANVGTIVHAPGRGLLLIGTNGSWLWDGVTWTTLAASVGSPGLGSASFDTARDRVTAISYSSPGSGVSNLSFERLIANPREPQPGNTITFDVDSPQHAGQPWVLAWAWHTWPGIPLGPLHPTPGRLLPLAPDALFAASLGRGLTGFLDSAGRAQTSWSLPNDPGLAGLRLFGCAISITPALTVGLVSNPVEIYVLP